MRATIFILTFLFSTTLLFGQAEKRINIISKRVEQINTDTTLAKKKVLDNEQWMDHATDGGGELTAYINNGQIIKIVEWVGLSSCISIYEYYLQNGSLIFVYGQEKVFKYDDETNTFDYNIQTVSTESSYYFDN